MARKQIFINNLDTFVAQQVLAELRAGAAAEGGEGGGEADEEGAVIFGTYFDKDSSDILSGAAKMMKVRYNFTWL